MTPVAAQPPTPAATRSPCTALKVRSLARRVTQLYDEILAPSGLRITQYGLIAHARRSRGVPAPTVSALAAALVTDRTTLTRNLRPLIAAGLLRLEPGPDARSKAVVVTEAGEAAWREARTLWQVAQARVRELSGPRNIERLEGLIDEVLPALGAADREPR
jgi:DNA-binding MarR family transcriptional regulator